MSLGRFGTLIGFAVSIIGAGLAILYPSVRGIGFILVAIGLFVLAASLAAAIYSVRANIIERAKRLGAAQIILLIGIAGIWLFMTTGLATAAWMIGHSRDSRSEVPA
jgi:hypothetical protein